ncbi:MAG: hypothetical protein ACREJ2_02715 [Planctomycetota bacterium]
MRGGGLVALLALTGLCGCGQPPALLGPPVDDPRGGTPRDIDAAALYGAGLSHAWAGQFGQAVDELQQARRIDPDQPLILAALGFALDDLAHSGDDPALPPMISGSPDRAPTRREVLGPDAYACLARAAALGCDDERVYERLAAHWYRISKSDEMSADAARQAGNRSAAALAQAAQRAAEERSAHESYLALSHLAADPASDLAQFKARVYVKHLERYFREHGRLREELAVVQIHRRLDPDDEGVQFDEVELLALTGATSKAATDLARIESQLAGRPEAGAWRRRIDAARVLLQRMRALNAPGGANVEGAQAARPSAAARAEQEAVTAAETTWLEVPSNGLGSLWEIFWRDFDRETPANPLG